jgi:hypothetical protein
MPISFGIAVTVSAQCCDAKDDFEQLIPVFASGFNSCFLIRF